MSEYEFQMRRKKRGIHCLINCGTYGSICGCGNRTPPTKKYKNRIVRRSLSRQLRRLINEE